MKVVAFSGSPRKGGNTAALIRYVFEELEKEGIECELVELAGKQIRGCIACRRCGTNQDKQCAVRDEIINHCIDKMVEADGIILGSPTYFANMTTEMKALIDRAGFVAKMNGDMFKHKVGAAVVIARRGGADHVFNSINQFFLISQMVIPGSSYWNIAVGLNAGDVEKDEEGVRTMRVLGQNMAWLLKKLKA
ncbi:MAG: flavodoxin family protein [Clostridia bacterium]|nr:flavodoxin family protein [Clostridia bacterium]